MSANTNTTPAGTVVSIPVIDITTLPTDLKTVAKEAGVADLHLTIRGPFAKALIAERMGNTALAQSELERAVSAESARD